MEEREVIKTAKKNQRLRVFENKVLRKIFGAKRDEVTGEWRKLHNTELHALYSSPDIIRNIKSRRLKWAGHVARMGESRNAYRVLVGRPEGKRPLGRPKRRWEENIKMDLREVGYDDREWINLAQDRDQWRAYVRAAMNLRVVAVKETLRGHSDSSFRGEGYIQCCVGVRLCDMYSNQELAEIHFMYGKADGSAALACRLYQERYPQRQCPDRKTFVRLHYRLCEYGNFNSPGLGRGRPRSTTPEVQEEIVEAVNMTPSISTRRVALQVNVPHTTVWRLLKEYQLYPYHI
ncbi:hypothetical protein ANN_11817 [Periplaneta americana]|uniref:DUF4817 domain-containing protein n=1 Tax=Periplaneta americana TaxID=6978 RepID=A0ABQ8T6R8_PERAM|nr:hypothetical protein ANN_11817 [Periplaneta americana]